MSRINVTAGLPEFSPKSKNKRYLSIYNKTTTVSRDKTIALVKKYQKVLWLIDSVMTTIVAGIKLNDQGVRE
jgi:hypothetical protein